MGLITMSENVPTPPEIYQLLISKDHEDNERGYAAFLRRTHWFTGGTKEDLKNHACNQLNVPPSKVMASLKMVEPAFLWASQDGLESEKLKMVEAAYAYITVIGEKLPPVVVWNFYDSQAMRLVMHDGHHRAYFSHRIQKRVEAVILEPLGYYNRMEDKFRYAFYLRKRVIDLPVSRTRNFNIKVN